LQPGRDVGVSFVPSPDNPPAHPTYLNITGQPGGGAACKTSTACKGPGSFSVSRANLRFGDGAAPHVFDVDIVAHAACWRGGVGFSAEKHAEFWEPQSARIKEIEGLGSYSSYLGNLSDAKFGEMGYSLNWDLSGRFFPYAGQFLPPVEAGATWRNDAEGTQPRANASFAIIDNYYGRIQAAGFHTLSYFNVFEYGENVCRNESWSHHALPACRAQCCCSADAGLHACSHAAPCGPKCTHPAPLVHITRESLLFTHFLK